ncbi:MAG: hypothetical protein QM706_14075 [Nitrospira sp.]
MIANYPFDLDAYRCAKRKTPQQLPAPLPVTASPEQPRSAQTALEPHAFDRNFEAFQAGMQLRLNLTDEQSRFDMAASVKPFTRQRAMEPLLIQRTNGSPP